MFGFGPMLKDYLNYYKISQTDFANKLGISKKHMNEILNGNTEISSDIILAISLLTDIDVSLILYAENKRKVYNYLNTKFENEKEIKKYLNNYHIKELDEKKWVNFKDITSNVQNALDILEFLNVKNFDLVNKYNENRILYKKKDDADLVKVAMWIRRCDKICQNDEINIYDKTKLNDLLEELKMERLKKFDPIKLKKIFNKYGIYFVIEESLKGSKIRGCMMVKGNNPAIYMTKHLHELSSFYFALYHEIGHVKTDFNKAKNKVLVDDVDSDTELKADIFALEQMIPNKIYEYIKQNIDDIEIICKNNNIPICFATSRLAKDKIITYNSNLYQNNRINI